MKKTDEKTNELRPNIDLVKVVNDVFEEEGFGLLDNGTYRILALTCLQKLVEMQLPKDGLKLKIVCDCDYYTSMLLNGQKVCSNCEEKK